MCGNQQELCYLLVLYVTHDKPKSLFTYVIIKLSWANWPMPFFRVGGKLNFVMFNWRDNELRLLILVRNENMIIIA